MKLKLKFAETKNLKNLDHLENPLVVSLNFSTTGIPINEVVKSCKVV